MDKEPKDIAYQNKDIISKIFSEHLRNKAFSVYGIQIPKIVDILPTNLPAVQANELRIDNLFLLEDGTLALVDYESQYLESNYVKYMSYIIRILDRYPEKEYPKIRMIVIYTADVEHVEEQFSVGCMGITIQPAYLSKIDSDQVVAMIQEKLCRKESFTDEELMKFIILPLTYKGEKKLAALKDTIEYAKQIEEKEIQNFVLSGILVFCNKIMSEELSSYIKEAIRMTKVAELLINEGAVKERQMFIVKLSKKMDIQQIAEITDLPVEEIKDLLDKSHRNE